jgi:hypothetical protein
VGARGALSSGVFAVQKVFPHLAAGLDERLAGLRVPEMRKQRRAIRLTRCGKFRVSNASMRRGGW